MSFTTAPLSTSSLSLDHQALVEVLSQQDNLLIIQDLDGVCMGLVRDPLTRVMEPDYIRAVQNFAGHFMILTNGEHIGKRGVNRIVEQAFNDTALVQQEGLYLPGLAAGGVQWQDSYGKVSHPGVSEAELAFLAAVPKKIEFSLKQFFAQDTFGLSGQQIQAYIAASILDNKVSPTANLNVFYDAFAQQPEVYLHLQREIAQLMAQLLEQSREQGLDESFFVHYAPNLGKDATGQEIIQLATDRDSGTTDFQFMLRGGIKEVGVVVILNYYYYLQTGNYPLGKDFNARQAPQKHQELLELIKANFSAAIMPQIVGVGDTVTSKAEVNGNEISFRRGGSDRGFLQLVQDLNQDFQKDNIVVYIDSSGGEVKNRKPLKIENSKVVAGAGDSRDISDPLILNVVFPEGHQQYIKIFKTAALKRHNRK